MTAGGDLGSAAWNTGGDLLSAAGTGAGTGAGAVQEFLNPAKAEIKKFCDPQADGWDLAHPVDKRVSGLRHLMGLWGPRVLVSGRADATLGGRSGARGPRGTARQSRPPGRRGPPAGDGGARRRAQPARRAGRRQPTGAARGGPVLPALVR